MEIVFTQTSARSGAVQRQFDSRALSAWVLTSALVVYLALEGGGYALAVHSQIGIAVWWIVVVGAAFGLLPVARLGRAAWAAVGLFAAFIAWTALATTWSITAGRSLADLSLVACYLGVLVLAVSIHRDRAEAVRHTVGAAATAIVVVAGLAVASRLWPHLFASSQQTTEFLGSTRARLSWPLNYWNALAALTDLGIPLLLALATSARTLRAQAAAAAGIPLVALCAALTLSRGGVIAGTIALIVFLALAPERFPKLLSALVAAAGSGILIAGAFDRHALQQGLANTAARHQAGSLLAAILLVCAGVAVIQVGVSVAVRHGTPPRLLTVPPKRARVLLAIGIAALVAAGLIAGVPSKLDRLWRDFKNPVSTVSGTSVSRFSSTSGEGRYQYWVAAVHSTRGHVLGGSGPGTFQLLWLPRAPFESYVVNAHSLYVETLAEEGVVGLVLLIAFFVIVVGAAIRLVARTRHEERTRAAGVTAALVAFLVYAAFDWIWQMPVLPAVFLLLAAAVLAPRAIAASKSTSRTRRVGALTLARVGAIALGAGSLIAIAFPLATSSALVQSQAAASAGNTGAALTDAREAVRLEPGSAAAQLQVALVLELGGDYPAAIAAAHRAVGDEPQNWSNWLTLSRLEAEAGHAGASVRAYRQARSLNPQSPLFSQ
ncbi:MAG: O-antigen ligase family protein [Solirubrobacteraceae bacterium]